MTTSDKTYGKDILKAVTSGLIGAVPIFGDFLSGATGLLSKWNTDRKQKALWRDLHRSVQQNIKMQVEVAKAEAIEKELRGFDENLNQVFADYDQLRSNSEAVTEVQGRLAALIDRIRAFQPKVYEDEMYTYATAPFLEHFFLDYLVALVTGDLIGAKSHNFQALRRQLYLDTEEYLTFAMRGIAKERLGEVNTRSGPNNNPINHDVRTKLDLSEHYNTAHPYLLLPCSQRAVAVVGAAQLMRIPVVNLSVAIQSDELVKSNAIKANIFKDVYSQEIRTLHHELAAVWKSYGSFYDSKFTWEQVYGKLHADHGKVADSAWRETYSNCANRVIDTIFDAPGGRDVPDQYYPSVLRTNGVLTSGTANDRLASRNGKYVLQMQTDGNLVLYSNGRAIWASNTMGKGSAPYRCTMQSDGNLVLHGSTAEHWASGSYNNSYSEAHMQDDGNFVIRVMGNRQTWETKTAGK